MSYKLKCLKIILLATISLIFVQCMNNKMQNKNEIIFNPIGVIHSSFTPETGAPRQGILIPENTATICIFDPYQKALETLDEFEYIIVLYHLDKVKSWEPFVNPSGSSHNHKFGLFATRSPNRPNPIGFSVIKLDQIKEGVLFVRGLDAFDGTPVLDIKPYLPSIDCVESQQNKKVEKELGL